MEVEVTIPTEVTVSEQKTSLLLDIDSRTKDVSETTEGATSSAEMASDEEGETTACEDVSSSEENADVEVPNEENEDVLLSKVEEGKE